MPRGKKSYRSKRTRKYTPKKSLVLGGFPKQKVVKMRYVSEFNLTSTSGVSQSYNFRANSPFDPDLTGVGHQCKTFDQWMAVYSHFNVLGSKAKVRLLSTNGVDHIAYGVCRTPVANQMVGLDLSAILENRYQKGYRITGSGFQYGGLRAKANVDLVTKYSQKKQHGANSTSRTDLTGSISTNPTESTIFEVWQCATGGAMSSKTCAYLIIIDYIVLLTEPKVLPQS